MTRLALVCGMKSEAAILGKPDNAVVIVGAGNAVKLATDLHAAIDGGCTHVLSFGTCGALNPVIKTGEIVVAGMMVDPPASGIFCDAAWSKNLRERTGGRPVIGTISAVTIATAAAKAALYAATKADVVDMESWAAAAVAHAHGVPFAMLRAVSDAAGQDVPPAALAAMDAAGGVDAWGVIESLVEDDEQLPALMALDASSRLAFDALAKAVIDIGINFGVPS